VPSAPTKQTSREPKAAPTAIGFAAQGTKKEQPGKPCRRSSALVMRQAGATAWTVVVASLGRRLGHSDEGYH
jgi:hypothetical protein